MKPSETPFREVFNIYPESASKDKNEEVYLLDTLLIISKELPEETDCLSFAKHVKKSLPYIYDSGEIDIEAYYIINYILDRNQIPTQNDIEKLKLKQSLK